jgi:hypothetical protein
LKSCLGGYGEVSLLIVGNARIGGWNVDSTFAVRLEFKGKRNESFVEARGLSIPVLAVGMSGYKSVSLSSVSSVSSCSTSLSNIESLSLSNCAFNYVGFALLLSPAWLAADIDFLLVSLCTFSTQRSNALTLQSIQGIKIVQTRFITVDVDSTALSINNSPGLEEFFISTSTFKGFSEGVFINVTSNASAITIHNSTFLENQRTSIYINAPRASLELANNSFLASRRAWFIVTDTAIVNGLVFTFSWLGTTTLPVNYLEARYVSPLSGFPIHTV